MAWGPGARLRAPVRVQGQSPGGGLGGRAPLSSAILAIWKALMGLILQCLNLT